MLSTVIVLRGHKKVEDHLPVLLSSAQLHGWDMKISHGKNGLTEKFVHKIDQRYPKAARQFERPGVRGCFSSHYELWKNCTQTMAIFEHDVILNKAPPTQLPDADVIKLDGFRPSKPAATGQWWEGAHAYIITAVGAKKLVEWTERWGASPADFMLGDKVVNIAFDLGRRVKLIDLGSTTWNLETEIN